MIIHWGTCPFEELKDKYEHNHEELKKEILYKSKEYDRYIEKLLEENRDLKDTSTLLEKKFLKQQEKIKHLEEVLSDYSKAALLEKVPAYVEIIPLQEVDKPKRRAK